MSIVALIPARGGSKSVPFKNIKQIAGKPLIQWALEAAHDCYHFSNIYVSTDSPKIAETVGAITGEWSLPDVWVIDRSPETATDTAPAISYMLDFADRIDFDHLCVIQCTSPLLESTHLNEGIEDYLAGSYDSYITVVRQNRFVWQEFETGNDIIPVGHPLMYRPRRQDWNGILVENGAYICISRDALLRGKSRLCGKVGYYEMPEWTYTEIDEEWDWQICDRLLKWRSRQSS